MTTDTITLKPINAATANAAAQVILNRLDTQIRRLENGWSGGWNGTKLTVADIKTTYNAAHYNIEFLYDLCVINVGERQQLRNQLHNAKQGVNTRRETHIANAAHDKIRNDLAKSGKPCDI
jgi:hypothetical protein